MKKLLSSRIVKAAVFSALALVIGLVAWVITLMLGLGRTTGQSNMFNWGILISIFAFLVGIGAGSQLVASYLFLRGKKNHENLVLPLQALSVGCGIGAGVAVTIDLGSPFHIAQMLLTPNMASPLFWDMVGLTIFIVIGVGAFVSILKGWRFAWGVMVLAGVSAVALQIIEGLLFALQGARAWWASPIMVVDFLVVAIVCGISAALIVSVASSSSVGKSFTKPLAAFVVVHIVLSLSEVIHLATDVTPLNAFAVGSLLEYLPLYVAELALPLLAVILLLFKRVPFGASRGIVCGSLVLVGILAHRLMLLYPAFMKPTLSLGLSNAPSPQWLYPLSTGLYGNSDAAFATLFTYLPAVPELISVLLPLGVSGLVLTIGLASMQRLSR